MFLDNMGGSAANRAQVSTTITTNGTTTATVGSAVGLAPGMFIKSTNIAAGTTISAISGTTVTLSVAASGTGTAVAARFSPFSDAQVLGAAGGELTHTLTIPEMPAHTHLEDSWQAAGTAQTGAVGGNFGSRQTGSTGGGQPHNVVQPTLLLNAIIKT